MTLPAEDAAELCRMLEQAGVRYWVMGGWGVDALLASETRPHKDLDVLISVHDIESLHNVLEEHGFHRKRVWTENRWLDGGETSPSAFVVADRQGRELDVHVIDVLADGRVVQHFDHPWPLPVSIETTGMVGGKSIPCVSLETQLAMHVGYPMPAEQLRDLELLRAALARSDDIARR